MNVLPLLGLFLQTEMTLPYPPNTLNKWNAYSFLYLNPEKGTPLSDPNELKQERIILHLITQELTHISKLPCNTEDRSLPWPWFLESRLSLIAE